MKCPDTHMMVVLLLVHHFLFSGCERHSREAVAGPAGQPGCAGTGTQTLLSNQNGHLERRSRRICEWRNIRSKLILFHFLKKNSLRLS